MINEMETEPDDSAVAEFYQTLKELTVMLHKLFHNIEREEMFIMKIAI
jgi:hypothetical protein